MNQMPRLRKRGARPGLAEEQAVARGPDALVELDDFVGGHGEEDQRQETQEPRPAVGQADTPLGDAEQDGEDHEPLDRRIPGRDIRLAIEIEHPGDSREGRPKEVVDDVDRAERDIDREERPDDHGDPERSYPTQHCHVTRFRDCVRLSTETPITANPDQLNVSCIVGLGCDAPVAPAADREGESLTCGDGDSAAWLPATPRGCTTA